jgi:hypothetical protein
LPDEEFIKYMRKIKDTLTANRLAVVIATCNQIEYLNNLLESIKNNSQHPETVVVISSGINIDKVIGKYNQVVNIIHEHVNINSQSFQKNIGLEKIRTNHEFVLFLDDYFTLEDDFFARCYFKFKNLSEEVVGLGLKISNFKPEPITFPKLRLTIHNSSKKAGHVTKSGIGVGYQENKNEIQTAWLNALSIWRTYIFNEFKFAKMTSRYSAIEDLIFSYPIGKKCKLIYSIDLTVHMQNREIAHDSYFYRAFYTNLHRRYFINKYSEFSKNLFYINIVFFISYHFLKLNHKLHRNYFRGNLTSLLYLIFFEIFNFFKLIDDDWLINQ